jgi:hypothetical protein
LNGGGGGSGAAAGLAGAGGRRGALSLPDGGGFEGAALLDDGAFAGGVHPAAFDPADNSGAAASTGKGAEDREGASV